MKTSHIVLAALTIALCFAAVEARSKGTVLPPSSPDEIEENPQDHEQGVLRYRDRRQERGQNRDGPVVSSLVSED